MKLRSLLCQTCAGLALALCPAAAFAQATKPPLDQSLAGASREAYAEGKMLFEHGDFRGALLKFRQAYETAKDPRLLYNMALCQRDLRAYAKMKGLLEQYEHDAGPSMTRDEKTSVDRALATIQDLVAPVEVTTSVAGATLTVDGEAAGTTPLASPIVLDLGTHTLSAQKDGFQSTSRTVEVTGGKALALAMTLVPIAALGHLIIETDPDAGIAIDDRPVGSGSFDGNLPSGLHDVTLKALGKKTYATQIDLRTGETKTLDVTLLSEGGPAPIWPWIVGGAAVVAGGAVGGYFLFRSKPDETSASSTIPQAGTGLNFRLSSLGGH